MLNDPDVGWSSLMELPRDMQRVGDDWTEIVEDLNFYGISFIPLSEIVTNNTEFKTFLRNDLNLTERVLNSFSSSSVNMSHLMKSSVDNTVRFYQCLIDPFALTANQCEFEKSIVSNPSPYGLMVATLLQAIQQQDINLIQKDIQELLITSAILRSFSCDDRGLMHLFKFHSRQDENNVESALCGLSKVQRESLARELAGQLTASKAMQDMDLSDSLPLYQHISTDTQTLANDYKFVSKLQFYVRSLYEADPDLWELQSVRYAYRGPVRGDPVDIVEQLGPNSFTAKYTNKIQQNIKCRLLCGNFTSYCKTTSLGASRPLRYASGYEAKGARKEKSVASRLQDGVKILYAPQTHVVNEVIRWANRTMEQIASLGLFALEFANYTTSLESLMENLTFTSNFTTSVLQQICNLTSVVNNQTESVHTASKLIRRSDVTRWMDTLHYKMQKSNKTNESYDSDFVLNEYCNHWEQIYSSLSNGNLQSFVSMLNSLAKGLADQLNDLKLDVWMGFPDEQSLDEYAAHSVINESTIWAGVVFTNLSSNWSLPPHVQYKIKMNKSLVFDPGQLRDRDWRPGPRDSDFNLLYEVFGFVYIQDLIDRAIVNFVTNKTVNEPGGYLQQFPYPCYNFDRFAATLYQYSLLSVVLVFSWVFSVAMIIRNVVHEKEQRLKEMMKIMGISGASLWISWFITSFLSVAVSSLVLTVILKVGRVFIHSDFLVIFLFFLNYGVAMVMMCFVFSTLFNRSNLAAVAGGILYLVTYIPFSVYRNYEYEFGFSQKGVLCLLSTTAFASGCNYIARWEEMGDGMQWYNIGESTVPGDTFSFLSVNLFIAIDALLYAILVWYIDSVFPGQYGIPRSWYFPLQSLFWCRNWRCTKEQEYSRLSVETPDETDCAEDITIGVSIRNLVKIYGGGKVAVDDLTLDLFEGQITCLLGRNGAGKTTTMSVLTGLLPPTSGVVHVLGRDVMSEIVNIRKVLGFCPQHNILFNKLTVEEHLRFFLTMKCPFEKSSELNENINRWLNDLSLTSKRKSLISSLSGGMKRKLSVAIAFVGSSRLVVLDEPTAGVDPYARREIWDLLAKYKDGRTIVLSTHYMDEADILGDRVAVISHGKLCFVGTPIALKSRLCPGYQLTLVKQQKVCCTALLCSSVDAKIDGLDESDHSQLFSALVEDAQTVDGEILKRSSHASCATHATNSMRNVVEQETVLSHCHVLQRPATFRSFNMEDVRKFVHLYVNDAWLHEDSAAETTFTIPATAARDSRFSSLLRELDLCKEKLGIASYGVSDSSFDQAFLAVTAETEKEEELSEDGEDVKQLCSTNILLNFLNIGCWCRRQTTASGTDVSLTDVTHSTDNHGDDEAESNTLLLSHSQQESQEGIFVESTQFAEGLSLHWQCFKALMTKRFLYTKRDGKGFICQVILPVLFIFVALLVEHFKPEPVNSQIELSPTVYPADRYFPFLNFQKNKSVPTQLTRAVEQLCGISAHFLVERLDRTPCMQYMSKLSAAGIRNGDWWTHPSHNNWLPSNVSCSCTRGRQVCPVDVASSSPPSLQTIDKITIQELNNKVNVTDYLIKTVDAYELHRYGGLTVGNENSQYGNVKANGDHKQWIEMLGVRTAAKAWFNNRGYHAGPIYINVLNNAILRANLNESENISQYGITTYSDPFSWTASQLVIEKIRSGYDFVFAVFAMIAVSFIPPTFIMFLIQEQASGAKHQQMMSGLHPLIYWTANLVWDLLSYLVMVLCLSAVFLAFQPPTFTSLQSFPAVVVLFTSFGWAMIPMLYLTSFIFQDSSLAYVSMLALSLLIGLLTTVTSAILQFLQQYDDSYDDLSSLAHQLFLIFPTYGLGQGLVDIAYDYYTSKINTDFGDLGISVESVGPFSLQQHAIGMSLIVMVTEGIGCVALVVLVEYKFFISKWLKKMDKVDTVPEGEDEDVAAERRTVINGSNCDVALRLVNLTKIYGLSFRAVDNVCLSVSKHECFGLLGMNGAGKTTLFRMLTGDLAVTHGDAMLLGKSIVRNIHNVRHSIGYCPQFDAINDKLTGKEHLILQAQLKGMSTDEMKENVQWCLEILALSEYGDVMAGKYSGGNRRKLSTAIALVGKPQIVILDEPTTGMDPSARRFVWKVIRNLTREGHSVILSSHSMEECEAVCTRIGIMVNGRFVCLGSPQHLKTRYGKGYTITLRLNRHEDSLEVITEFFRQTFPSAILKERHYNMLQFQLLADDVCLSHIFTELENRREDFHIDDFSVSQTTLDNIFLGFAKQQRDGIEDCNERAALWATSRVLYRADEQHVYVQHPLDMSEN
ncbi:ATP-binding cassette sub-family A member 2-like isoform X2 [Corticium candelabrum]|uniref:ATP-binding cassette sub-family A member 2-like isoform X2 n=1 Tax=Corticium candelabrum TaxID=121492 RepID=UPI002E260DF9|nr:ATP-binding cassette sub-family A member 2-like isoform X2 [Corticium candelabrum]